MVVVLILSLCSIISNSEASLFLSSANVGEWLSVLRKCPTLPPRLSLQCVYILVYCSIPQTSWLCLLPTSTFSWNVILLSFIASLHDIPSHVMLWNRMRSCRLKGHPKERNDCINTKFILHSVFFKHFRKYSILHAWQEWMWEHCFLFEMTKKFKPKISQDRASVK